MHFISLYVCFIFRSKSNVYRRHTNHLAEKWNLLYSLGAQLRLASSFLSGDEVSLCVICEIYYFPLEETSIETWGLVLSQGKKEDSNLRVVNFHIHDFSPECVLCSSASGFPFQALGTLTMLEPPQSQTCRADHSERILQNSVLLVVMYILENGRLFLLVTAGILGQKLLKVGVFCFITYLARKSYPLMQWHFLMHL